MAQRVNTLISKRRDPSSFGISEPAFHKNRDAADDPSCISIVKRVPCRLYLISQRSDRNRERFIFYIFFMINLFFIFIM